MCLPRMCEQTVPVASSLWPADELGMFLQEVLCGGFGRGCCWLCRAAWCAAMGAAPSPCAGSRPCLSAAAPPKKQQAENHLFHQVLFPWLCPGENVSAKLPREARHAQTPASAPLLVSFEPAAQQIWRSSSTSGSLIFPAALCSRQLGAADAPTGGQRSGLCEIPASPREPTQSSPGVYSLACRFCSSQSLVRPKTSFILC